MSIRLSRGGLLPVWLTLVLLPLAACQPADPAAGPGSASGETALEHAQKHLDTQYQCPMHPQIVRDAPGTCPICGMTLVPIKAAGPAAEASGRPAVVLSGVVTQNLGVRTEKVERGTLWKAIRTLGRVAYDETRLAHVHPRANGWVERLAVRAEGDEVKRGQVMGYLYAPSILSAQVDFLVALRQYGKSHPDKADKARNLLRLLDVPDTVIKEIERQGETLHSIPMLAPITGVVTKLGVRDGMYVEPGTEMVTIADLASVWVLVDVFEQQLDWLKPGQPAEIRVPAHPGQVWKGEVEYLYPDLDPQSRTLRARLRFPNPDGLLKPNMFADVLIKGGPKADVLHISRDALIVTGERETVITALGEGRFQPVDVTAGMQRGGRVEILQGLAEGDEVVVSGQFLIDSESSLQASLRRLAPPPEGGGHTGH